MSTVTNVAVCSALLALSASCDGGGEHSPPASPVLDAQTNPVVTTRDAWSPTRPIAPGPPVDPGNFQRFGCATDAMPPHIATGTATVTWRPTSGSPFSFMNLPARCGGAFPGQLIDGVRSRPGDGAEFVVCMPDERRLDIGMLRRGAVPPGTQDVAHTANLVRLRIVLDRFVNVVAAANAPDPSARLVFGPHLRSANGSVRLATSAGAVAGTVDFQIDCQTPR